MKMAASNKNQREKAHILSYQKMKKKKKRKTPLNIKNRGGNKKQRQHGAHISVSAPEGAQKKENNGSGILYQRASYGIKTATAAARHHNNK